MRIVHVANEVVSAGNGIVNSAVDLACLQAEAGHDVSFISSGGGFIDLLSRYGVRHYEVCLYHRAPLQLLRDLPRLKRLIARLQPDIVHAHMMTTAVMMRLGRDWAGFGTYGLVTTVHNEWRSSSNLMQVGDRVIALSESGRKLLRRRGFSHEKLRVVRHGILHSPRRRDDCALHPGPPKTAAGPVLVTIAGLYRRKGVGDLIQAFDMIADDFPTASLEIVGWGPDHTHFETMIAGLQRSERIHLRGFVDKPQSILRHAAVFVLASHTETFPLAVAEAREAGCAIIATDVGGVPELLEHGGSGILVPPRRPDLLAEEMRRLLGNQGELDKWRLAARSNLGWLSCDRMSIETMDVYCSLLQRGRE